MARGAGDGDVIVYRQAPPGYPFLWESADQPPGRWHAAGEGPAQYFATSPEAAWAELIRHEEITDPEDLVTVRRAMWAVDLPDDAGAVRPDLDLATLRGGRGTYRACQREAGRLREAGAEGIRTPSAALEAGPSGHRVDGGLVDGPERQDDVIVLFGRRPRIVAHLACAEGRPSVTLLPRVRRFRARAAS
jgi:hypothetical protein